MIERNQDNTVETKMINENECEEIFEFFSFFNKLEVMKIPGEILDYLNTNRNKEFKTKIDKNDLFNFSNISSNALNFLIYIDMTYWRNEKNKKANVEQVFKEKINNNNQKIIKFKSKNIIQKITDRIKSFFIKKRTINN